MGLHGNKEDKESILKAFDVSSIYYDGSVKTSWSSPLSTRSDALIVLDSQIPFKFVNKGKPGEFPNRIRQYYWIDKWFNAFAFYNEGGEFSRWYCNIACPPKIEGSKLTFIDLDLDVLWVPPESPQILDREEFEKHRQKFNYPQDIVLKTEQSLQELLNMINNRIMPFDHF
ncbi:MAG: DUF402 domain-containing protein [Nanoarchaeota archaeon]|nr:DUF402 domain-containing protein [Nanoarchaeota archaeon]